MIPKVNLAIVLALAILLPFILTQDYSILQPALVIPTPFPLTNSWDSNFNDVFHINYNGSLYNFWGGTSLLRMPLTSVRSALAAARETIDRTDQRSGYGPINSVYIDATRGMGFYCTANKIALFDPFGTAPVTVTEVLVQVEILNIVKCIYDPKRGNLWAALDTGLFVIEDVFGVASPQASILNIATGVGTIVLDSVNDLIFFGATSGNIYKTLSSNTKLSAQFIETRGVGIGDVSCSVFDPNRGRVLMGTTVGLVVEIEPVTFVFSRFSFLPQTKLTAATIDAAHDATFWAATYYDNDRGLSRSMVVRFNLRTFQWFSSNQILGTRPYIPDIKALVAAPDSDVLYFHGKTTSNPNVLLILTHTRCTGATTYHTCLDCTEIDPEYCGWCFTNNRCQTRFATIPCEFYRGGQDHDISTCLFTAQVRPNPVDFQPDRAVTVVGNYEFNGTLPELSDTLCIFTSDGQSPLSSATQSISQGQIICPLPNNINFDLSVSSRPTLVEFTILSEDIVLLSTANVDVVNCNVDNLDCNSCLNLHPSCGWCLADAECRFQANCTTFSQTCSSISSFTPLSSSIRTSAPVTFAVQPALTGGESFQCDFGLSTVPRVPATIVPPNQVICPSPQIDQATFNAERAGAVDVNRPVTLYYGSAEFATTSTPFMFYDCPTVNQFCVACNEAIRAECVFCSSGQTSSCAYKNTTTCTAVTTCAIVTSALPASTHISDVAAEPTIVLSGNFLIDGLQPTTLVCAWDATDQLTAAVTTAAVYVDADTINCKLPPSLTVGVHKLSVWRDTSVRLTPDVDYLIYDCSGDSCATCVDEALRPKCRWCSSIADGIGCKLQSDTCSAAVSQVGSCPLLLTASPDRDEVAGGQNVILNGPFNLNIFPNINTLTVSCSFTLPDLSTVVTQATFVDVERNAIFCVSPRSDVTGEGSVLIQIESETYTNAIPFHYYRCFESSSCDTCISDEKPRCNWCARSCALDCNPTGFPALRSCPVLERSRPTGAELEGGDLVTIYGGPFFTNKISVLTCAFGATHQPVFNVQEDSLQCYTPNATRNTAGTVELRVLLNKVDYTEAPLNFTFFGCNQPTSLSQCGDACLGQTGCGWCVGEQTCLGEARCTGIFLDSCLSLSVSPTFVNLAGTDPITITFNRPLEILDMLQPNTTNARRNVFQSTTESPFYCQFGTASVPAFALIGSNNSITCTPPSVAVDGTVPLTIIYRNSILAGPIDFQYLDCSLEKDCNRCQQKSLCNWCFTDNTCTAVDQCAAADWGTGECSDPSVIAATNPGLIAGVVIAAAVIAAGAVLLTVFIIRRRKRRQGFIVTIVEPDYVEVAFKNDSKEAFKDSDYNKLLEDILLNKDRTFLSTLFDITNPTEQDAVARSMIFLAQSRGISSEFLQYFCQTEIINSGSENTIFRQNSMASKMFKFYSKVVGTKYLYFTLATVINELNTFNATRGAVGPNGEASVVTEQDPEHGASLLNVEMELDPNKLSDPNTDTAANAIQLALACQKILSAIIKNEQNVPSEFRDLFVRMESAIKMRFGSEEAVYKAVGGFLFLRFICPAITAPQYYGLLQQNPNEIVQRQLVLIAKVLQNLANMASVNTKEEYMEKVADFVDRNIPKIKSFYVSLLDPERVHNSHMHMDLEVPENVKINALGYMQQHITRSEKRLRKAFNEFEEADTGAAMNELLDKLLENEPKSGKLSRAASKVSKKDRESLILNEDD